MNYSTVENLIWCNEDSTAFNCNVLFEGLGNIPFTCSVEDPISHAQDIWVRATNGEFGPIAAFVPQPIGPQPEVNTHTQIPLTTFGAIL
jgi:hypothetical protein